MPQVNLLPRSGFIVESNSKPVLCGFLYRTDSPLGIISSIISDRDHDKMEIHAGLDLLIKALAVRAKEVGVELLTVSTKIESLRTRFEKFGFQLTDENQMFLGRVI